MRGASAPLDLAFLDAQTFGDQALARDVLLLFLEQASRLVPRLADLSGDEQEATAHLLKGSCQGIGARPAAELLHRFGLCDPAARGALLPHITTAFEALEAAVAARLAAP